jgi:uncharacterized membrane protein YebE (DUF533 family)
VNRLKVAELTSGIGALVLGIGLGAMFSRWVAPSAALIALAGLGAHAFGMWDKHRIEARQNGDAGWVVALYWLCWLLLVGVAVVLVAAR